MNDFILLLCDYYSLIPIAIYLGMFYLGVYTGNYEEGISFMIFFFLNNTVTEIIKKLPWPESLWEVTRRPEGFSKKYCRAIIR